ncbi:MAG: hypothetical protein C7N36_08340 [Bacteroidetes bacterium]|nr:MAG: hypothetical protein C7N36_08340 [Bacteroidota bacterium]
MAGPFRARGGSRPTQEETPTQEVADQRELRTTRPGSRTPTLEERPTGGAQKPAHPICRQGKLAQLPTHADP